MKDFDYAFRQVRASVGTDDLEGYAKSFISIGLK